MRRLLTAPISQFIFLQVEIRKYLFHLEISLSNSNPKFQDSHLRHIHLVDSDRHDHLCSYRNPARIF